MGGDTQELARYVPYLFDAAALVLFAAAAGCLFVGKWRATRAGVAVAGGIACALIGKGDRLELIRFSVTGGLEAKIHQLEVGLNELQQIATAAAQANLTALAMSGQLLTHLSTQGKFHMRDDIINSLKAIGVSDDQILNAQLVWIGTYCNMIIRLIVAETSTSQPNALTEITALPRDPKYALPEPAVLEQWAKSHSLTSDRVSQLLDEYRRVWTTGSMKEPSIITGDQLETLPRQ